jgi:nucleoside-diphosphate-sugar epimerase
MADKVMIVGGSGFIGSHLAIALVERGDTVVNYDMGPGSPELTWLKAPYQDKIIFESGGVESWPHLLAAIKKYKPSKIAHLASPLDLAGLSRNPKSAFDIMVAGTINVLEAARLADIERLVFFSSIGILPTIQYQPIDANHPVLLATEGPGAGAYGIGKMAGEGFCWAYRQAYNLDFVILRPSAVYGFGTKNPIFLNPMVEGALHGEPVHFEHGRDIPRDYTHVHDVAGITVAALNIPAEKLQQRVFYAATGQPLVTAGQVAEIVKGLIPTADVEVGAGLTAAQMLEIRFRGRIDVKPVEEQLGYKIKYANIREGIAELIATHSKYMLACGQTPAVARSA